MKIKLYGMGNEEDFNHYEFDKKQKVAEYLSMILNRVFKISWEFHEEYKNKKRKWVSRKISINTYKDYHEVISSRNPRVDIFYGSKKMFMTINCSQKDRLKFNKELFKIAEMPKLKKLKGAR